MESYKLKQRKEKRIAFTDEFHMQACTNKYSEDDVNKIRTQIRTIVSSDL